jgi:hypothetical protein
MRNPFERDREAGGPSRDELMQTFLEVDLFETSALLTMLAELVGDNFTRARSRREVAARGHALPAWLIQLPATRVDGVVELAHVLRDGDNVMIGLSLPGGHAVSAVVYIDHNMGTLVKDAFVVPEPLPDLVGRMAEADSDPDITCRDLAPADARARITEAIELGTISYPPFETDTWPACRPLVEWAVQLLPEGGAGYQRPEWDDLAQRDLALRFLGSPFGAHLDSDHQDLLESLLWFGTDYGPGDPMRWSPTAVEILLLDWIPRKIVAEVDYLAKAPDVLRAFIGFCHHERGIRAELTTQTLDAVHENEPQFQRLIRSPRPQGPAALLAAFDIDGTAGTWPTHDAEDNASFAEIMLDSLRRAVGGDDALDRLDAVPLPDEPFAWEAISPDVHDRVADVLRLVDRYCEAELDTEFRTACRRLLAKAAAGNADVFRRRAQPETAAAAVCWSVAKANELFSTTGGGRTVKELMAHFGLTGAPQRAGTLLRAAGFNAPSYGSVDLGSPALLTSSRRRRIIERRDRYQKMDEL